MRTEQLVAELMHEADPVARDALLARRLDGASPGNPPGPRRLRVARDESDWMSDDVRRMHQVGARLEARLLAIHALVVDPRRALFDLVPDPDPDPDLDPDLELEIALTPGVQRCQIGRASCRERV